MKFLEAFANIFRVPDLRKRVLFTLGLLAVYRLGGHIPTPGINIERWSEIFNSAAGSIFGFFDLFAAATSAA
jgi:preprotein translocase subunit SecY